MYGEVSKRAQMHEAKHVPSRQMHDDRELRPRRSSALPDSASLATTNLGREARDRVRHRTSNIVELA